MNSILSIHTGHFSPLTVRLVHFLIETQIKMSQDFSLSLCSVAARFSLVFTRLV